MLVSLPRKFLKLIVSYKDFNKLAGGCLHAPITYSCTHHSGLESALGLAYSPCSQVPTVAPPTNPQTIGVRVALLYGHVDHAFAIAPVEFARSVVSGSSELRAVSLTWKKWVM